MVVKVSLSLVAVFFSLPRSSPRSCTRAWNVVVHFLSFPFISQISLSVRACVRRTKLRWKWSRDSSSSSTHLRCFFFFFSNRMFRITSHVTSRAYLTWRLCDQPDVGIYGGYERILKVERSVAVVVFVMIYRSFSERFIFCMHAFLEMATARGVLKYPSSFDRLIYDKLVQVPISQLRYRTAYVLYYQL